MGTSGHCHATAGAQVQTLGLPPWPGLRRWGSGDHRADIRKGSRTCVLDGLCGGAPAPQPQIPFSEAPDVLVWAATVKPPVCGHHDRNIFSHNSGVWNSKVKVPAGLISDENPLPGLQMSALSLRPHLAFPLCSCRGGAGGISRLSLPLLIRTSVLSNQDPTLMTPFNPDSFFKGSFSQYSNRGLGLQHMNIDGTRFSPYTKC